METWGERNWEIPPSLAILLRRELLERERQELIDRALIEDSSTDSVNQIESAIDGKAPRPPRPEKTPQARRQSVTGFITSIFKYKKQMEMETIGGTEEEKPAGSDSSEPRPTTLGLARIFPYEELTEATNGFKQQIGEGGFSSVYLGFRGCAFTFQKIEEMLWNWFPLGSL